MLFTDGTDRAARFSREDMKREIAEQKYENYEMLAIGVGAEIEKAHLEDVRIGQVRPIPQVQPLPRPPPLALATEKSPRLALEPRARRPRGTPSPSRRRPRLRPLPGPVPFR